MTNSIDITGESLLYLTDNQLRHGIEAMFFAYRGFTADPDRILEKYLKHIPKILLVYIILMSMINYKVFLSHHTT